MNKLTGEVFCHAVEWLISLGPGEELKLMRDNPDLFLAAASLTTLTPLEISPAKELLKICPLDELSFARLDDDI